MAYSRVVNYIVAQAAENVNETATCATAKPPNTPEGIAVACGSLVVMALLPIFFGSYRSVSFHKEQKRKLIVPHQKRKLIVPHQKRMTMTTKYAAMFPIMASFALFGLYIIFKLFSKEYINLLLTGYFFFVGVLTLTHILSPIVSKLAPAAVPNIKYHILFNQGEDDNKQDIINYKFSSHDIVARICCLGVGAWYLLQKHWVANNLFGMAFAVNAIELLHLNNVVTGCIFLSGLFIYDIFWVFGTDVMVTVAKNFDAPIKLVFPQDLLTHGLSANNFAMLGLGDIVVPGIFIALLLRFDHSLKRKSKLYFHSTIVAYFLGLMATIFVMHVFDHGQPALLYLVPACLGTPLAVALVKGDLIVLFKYEDTQDEKEESKKGEKQAKTTESKKVK